MIGFDINNDEHFELTIDDIVEMNNWITNTPIKINLMNDMDVILFANHMLVTNHEELIIQYVENITIWCHYIKKLSDKEEYELCNDMMKSLNKITKKYIAFITSLEYNEKAINKINDAKKLTIEKVLNENE